MDANRLAPISQPDRLAGILPEVAVRRAGLADGRPTLPPDAPGRAFSYTGTYQLDGDAPTTRVDGASSPEGLADQVRRLSFQGPNRFVAVPLSRVLGRTGLEFVWERVG